MGLNQYCAQCKCGGRAGRILARLIAFPLFLADLVFWQSICIQHKFLPCRFILLRGSVSPRSCMSSYAYWCIWNTWAKGTCSEEFICIYKNLSFFDRFLCYLGYWIDLKEAADPLRSCGVWSVGFHTNFISQFPLCAVEVSLEGDGESVCRASAHENPRIFLH